jgi:transcriptional regulator with XRE-family HTH domain
MGNRVQRIRQMTGLTVEELAERAGLTTCALRRVENSDGELAGDVLEKLAKALRVVPADLLEEPQSSVTC